MWIRTFIAAVLVAAAPHGWAQSVSLAPSEMLACLTTGPHGPTGPVYPELAIKRKDAAEIIVQLEFDGPGREPRIRIERNNFEMDFDDAVKDYARHLRLPCMPAGAKPVVLKQVYYFNPVDGRKVASPPLSQDAADVARQEKMQCVAWPERPTYPKSALDEGRAGKIFARLNFASPTAPPTVHYVALIGGNAFRRTMDDYFKRVRFPCLGEGAVAIDVTYLFEITGDAKTVLKDMELRTFLGGAKDPAPISANFDAMACPFAVRVTYRQPYAPNLASELESSHPARRPVLDWLSKVQLNLPTKVNDAIFADTFVVNIPCGRIEL